MDRLWAGWRMAYIAEATKGSSRKTKSPCLFCGMAKRRPGARNLLLSVTPQALVMLNLYPYNIGHVMVAPRRHRASPADLTAEEAVEITRWLGRVERALRREYRPHGFNMGVNLGRTAGAGVLGHLHWHVVPRWNGDTNFMPVLGDTKVLPEPLAKTYRRLKGALDATETRRRAR
ncbi:MAG TPA: HIT domain-containing protein [Candidatus Eisenbacteria bacterium]